jgi:undecaprenyl pyrophosphate synthase
MNDLAARIAQSREIIEKTPHVDFSYLTALLDHIETTERERDEARALVETLTDENEHLTTELEELTGKINGAEARGFKRGVREAAKVAGMHDGCCEDFAKCGYCTKARILALLEPTLRKPEA